MVNNATDSYAIGEVFDGDAGYACQYQSNGLDAFLNFPLYYTVSPACPLTFDNLTPVISRWWGHSTPTSRRKCPPSQHK